MHPGLDAGHVVATSMPELPEVETTRRGIEPHVAGVRIQEVIVRRRDLRQPVTESLSSVEGLKILGVSRRSKYLLFALEDGTTVLVHLGMSGSLRVIAPAEPWKKHDHIGLSLANGLQLRFHDPRRFGLFLHFSGPPMEHPLLASLGPEPLEPGFTAAHLHERCASRATSVKITIMDAAVVVGVGNIYASEALFRCGILPRTRAKRLSRPRAAALVKAIRTVLSESIEEGGTTLRDFLKSDGEPGYFKQRLYVYGRKGEPCRVCETPIRHAVMGQRATFWCPTCQR